MPVLPGPTLCCPRCGRHCHRPVPGHHPPGASPYCWHPPHHPKQQARPPALYTQCKQVTQPRQRKHCLLESDTQQLQQRSSSKQGHRQACSSRKCKLIWKQIEHEMPSYAISPAYNILTPQHELIPGGRAEDETFAYNCKQIHDKYNVLTCSSAVNLELPLFFPRTCPFPLTLSPAQPAPQPSAHTLPQ
jgi:hypothetical protein